MSSRIIHNVPRPLAAVLCGALLVTAMGACSSHSGPAASQPPASAGTSGPAVTLPSAAPSEALTASGAYNRAQEWFGLVQGEFTAIQNDTVSIAAAAKANDVSTLPGLCQTLRDDVSRAQSAQAPPDPRMRAAVVSGFDHYADAATKCLAGKYGETADQINLGAKDLSDANFLMANMHG